MRELPETRRDYQAEVYFALGAVIQGITVAALGDQLAAALRALPFNGATWVFVAGLQSLLLCIVFWYNFMDNYFFGFRVINLDAKAHFVGATLYLVLGLQQFIAIQFLDQPRMWLTLYVLLLATTLVGSWLSSRVQVVDEEGVREALHYDPGSRSFLIGFYLTVGCLIVWYAFPSIETSLFRALAFAVSGIGLVLFALYSVRVFQARLDVE